ncbi:hypothetical protein LEMLEM_LOCUS23901, partial [Lemmus lemmus]
TLSCELEEALSSSSLGGSDTLLPSSDTRQLVDKDANSQLLLQRHACQPAAMTVMNSNPPELEAPN